MFFNLPRSAENDNFLNIPTVNLPGGDFYGPLKEPDGTFSWNFANILELVLQMDYWPPETFQNKKKKKQFNISYTTRTAL